MSTQTNAPQYNVVDAGAKVIGYAAILYVVYKIIGLIFFLMVMLFLFTLPKDNPVKIKLEKEGIKEENIM